MRPALFALAAAVAAFAGPARADIIVQDGEFDNWTFTPFGTVAGSTGAREAAGGNPGASVRFTTVSTGGQGGVAGLKTDFTTTGVGFEGAAYTFTIDVSNGAGSFGNGQQLALVVEQNGAVYRDPIGPTLIGPSPPNYYGFASSGTIAAANFELIAGAGPATPDFSGGTSTRFGFAGFNNFTNSLTQNYDNYSLQIQVGPAAVPEPASLALAGAGVVGLLGVARQARRRVA